MQTCYPMRNDILNPVWHLTGELNAYNLDIDLFGNQGTHLEQPAGNVLPHFDHDLRDAESINYPHVNIYDGFPCPWLNGYTSGSLFRDSHSHSTSPLNGSGAQGGDSFYLTGSYTCYRAYDLVIYAGRASHLNFLEVPYRSYPWLYLLLSNPVLSHSPLFGDLPIPQNSYDCRPSTLVPKGDSQPPQPR